LGTHCVVAVPLLGLGLHVCVAGSGTKPSLHWQAVVDPGTSAAFSGHVTGVLLALLLADDVHELAAQVPPLLQSESALHCTQSAARPGESLLQMGVEPEHCVDSRHQPL
jgi:hypothetical protein